LYVLELKKTQYKAISEVNFGAPIIKLSNIAKISRFLEFSQLQQIGFFLGIIKKEINNSQCDVENLKLEKAIQLHAIKNLRMKSMP